MKTTELCPSPVLGPSSVNRLGKPAIIVPLWANIVSPQCSARDRPSRPITRWLIGRSLIENPVPAMIVSTSCSTPSAVTTACGRTSVIFSVTTSTFDAVERGQVGVREQDALAAHRVARRDLLAQLGVGDLGAHVPLGELRGLRHPRGLLEPEHEGLAGPVDGLAVEPLQGREAAERPLLEPGDRPVAPRHDPRGRALEDGHLLDDGRDLRHELDGRGPGADHGDAASAQVEVVAPGGGVEDLALEVLEPGDVGERGVGERAGAEDDRVGGPGALRRRHGPALVVVRPAGLGDLVVVPGEAVDPVLGRHPLQVGVDLRLGGERAAPVGVRREREGVEVAGHVAGAARVGVVPPGAADVAVALEDEEVLDAGLAEPDRGAEPGETVPDDGHGQMGPFPCGRAHVSPPERGTSAYRSPGQDGTSWYHRPVTVSAHTADPGSTRSWSPSAPAPRPAATTGTG